MNKTEIGSKRMKEILGNEADIVLEKFKAASPDFAKYVTDFAYGDVYCRDGLSDKSRELAAVAMLLGQGNVSFAFKAHIQGMLNVGWTQNEIKELILFAIPYVGFPTAAEALVTVEEILS